MAHPLVHNLKEIKGSERNQLRELLKAVMMKKPVAFQTEFVISSVNNR